MVKSPDCSFRSSGFNSKHPQDSSILSVAPVPGDQTPHTEAHVGKTPAHIKVSFKKY